MVFIKWKHSNSMELFFLLEGFTFQNYNPLMSVLPRIIRLSRCLLPFKEGLICLYSSNYMSHKSCSPSTHDPLPQQFWKCRLRQHFQPKNYILIYDWKHTISELSLSLVSLGFLLDQHMEYSVSNIGLFCQDIHAL